MHVEGLLPCEAIGMLECWFAIVTSKLEKETHTFERVVIRSREFMVIGVHGYVMDVWVVARVNKKREKYQDTLGSSSIYQNAPGSSKYTKLPLCQKKYTL